MAKLGKTHDVASATAGLFALIIGIDLYQNDSISNLKGAVNDAQAMKEYLQQDLGVARNHIIYLENQLATRKGIIKAFIDLGNLPELGSQSPILIYFAGHGVRVLDADLGEKMEALLPHDCDTFAVEGGLRVTHPILDKTISSLVESIYNKVGNNITFISDCCHSGSMTRGNERNVRGIHIPTSYRYPTKLDSNLILEVLPNGSKVPAPQTHVLLAACGAEEPANEARSAGEWHGEFTWALLTLLRSTSIDLLTPHDVLFKLPREVIKQQSPQCRGENSMRMFFRGGVRALKWYRVVHRASKDVYELNGGTAHGISEGATFKIFGDRNVNEPIGLATVVGVEPFHSTLEPAPSKAGFALLKHVGHFQRPIVYISEQQDGSHPITQALESISQRETHVYPTRGKIRKSCFSFTEEVNGTVTLANLDKSLSFPHSPHKLPIRLPADSDNMPHILAHVAQFFCHLGNTSPEDDEPLGIEIEVFKVGELIAWSPPAKSTYRRVPPGENLLQDGALEVIEAKSPVTTLYGFKLKNNSDRDWFVTILYFNGEQHTITKLYGSQNGGIFKADCPLHRTGELRLGYGAGRQEMSPFELNVSDARQHREFGVFKFIFTSKAVDFANICSSTSLEATSLEPTANRGIINHSLPQLEEWRTHCIPVIISRAKE